MSENEADSGSRDPGDVRRRPAIFLLCLIIAFMVVVNSVYLDRFTYPPHSSHDTYAAIPQFQKLFQGYEPEDDQYGPSAATTFHEPRAPLRLTALPREIVDGRLSGFFRDGRLFKWVDLPWPLGLAALAATLFPGHPVLVGLVPSAYLALLLVALYGMGALVASRRAGLLAAVVACGYPALFGFSRYMEGHLPVAAHTVLTVWFLLLSRGFGRGWATIAAFASLWLATRSGESVADAVGAGLTVIGPFMATLAMGSREAFRELRDRRWTQAAPRVVVILLSLSPLILVDRVWLGTMATQVWDGFLDPTVQNDVVAQGGWLATLPAWIGAYLILMVTDYLKPILALLALAGIALLPWSRSRHRVFLALWWLVPLAAFSTMPRKASWYAVSIVPPLALFTALGLSGIRSLVLRRVVIAGAVLVALVQMLLFTFVTERSFPRWTRILRDPLPLQDWRLRRVDLLRPVDEPGMRKTGADVASFLAWMDREVPRDERLKYVAVVTMAYKHDFPIRYLLGIGRPDLEVVSIVEPRFRESLFKGRSPSMFEYFIFVDDGFEPWPPSAEKLDWLSWNVFCQPQDPLTPFLGALLARPWTLSAPDLPPFYIARDKPVAAPPHRVWAPLLRAHSWQMLRPPDGSAICDRKKE